MHAYIYIYVCIYIYIYIYYLFFIQPKNKHAQNRKKITQNIKHVHKNNDKQQQRQNEISRNLSNTTRIGIV